MSTRAAAPRQRLHSLNAENVKSNPEILLNGRHLKIAICARQFMNLKENPDFVAGSTSNMLQARRFNPAEPNLMRDRGYGDIASGIKIIELLRKEYPEASMKFIVEHYAQSENELSRLKEMSTFQEIDTSVLDGNANTPNQQDVRNKVINILNDATVIIHAPSGLIEPIMSSSGEYQNKTFAVSEYDHRTGRYSGVGEHGVEENMMGFFGHGLYLTPSRVKSENFKNKTLSRLFSKKTSPDLSGKPDFQHKALYFTYSQSSDVAKKMLRNAILIESKLSRDIVFVASLTISPDEIEQTICETMSANYLDAPIKLVYEDSNQFDRIIPKDSFFGQAVKKISIVTPKIIEKEDFTLLERYASLNYSSGDISTSNVLGWGKIPIVDCSSKEINYQNLNEQLTVFVFEIIRLYDTVGMNRVMLPDEIWNTYCSRLSLITAWRTICESVSKDGYRDESTNLSDALAALNTREWQQFQCDFVEWLKSRKNADEFILSHVHKIIAKSEQGYESERPDVAALVESQKSTRKLTGHCFPCGRRKQRVALAVVIEKS